MNTLSSRIVHIYLSFFMGMVYLGGLVQTDFLHSFATHAHIPSFTFTQALYEEKIVIFDSLVDEQERVSLRIEDGASSSGQLFSDYAPHVYNLYSFIVAQRIPRIEHDVAWQQKTTSL